MPVFADANDSENYLAKELEFRKIERWVRWRGLGLDKWTIDSIKQNVIKLLEEDIHREKRRVHTLVRFKVLTAEQGDFLKKHIKHTLEDKLPHLWLLFHKQIVRDNREEMMVLNKEVERLIKESKEIRQQASKLRPKERADLFAEVTELEEKAEEMKSRHDALKEENKKIKKQYNHSFADFYRSYKKGDEKHN
ncbi:MAG: hypothetical protein GWP59_00755 [Chlamydiales bacterium]|nr:hypothetical protein [Chlamydiales bacterium]NCF70207.1 hypothetical protein [Chlamydiales bacterium]